MERTTGPLDLHVFVCTNKKKNKECCADKGAEELRDRLKEWSKSLPAWRMRIRINAAGCLDQCKKGIAIAIYPQNTWLTKVEKNDFEEVKSLIEAHMREIELEQNAVGDSGEELRVDR